MSWTRPAVTPSPLALATWPDPPLKSSRVAIVGFATESRMEVPWNDPDCEVWGLNMCEGWMLLAKDAPGRLDRMWELHDLATLEQESTEKFRSVDHLAWLRANVTIPVYTVETVPDFPMSVRQPVDLLKAYLAPLCEKIATGYFTSTFAFMIATALMGIENRRANRSIPEAGEEIIVAGVELLNGEEYSYQRHNAEFWSGVCLGKGIKLTIPARSALLESDGLYGYAQPESLELCVRQKAYYSSLRDKALKDREDAAARRNQAMSDYQTHDGAAQGLDRVINHLTYLIRGGKV